MQDSYYDHTHIILENIFYCFSWFIFVTFLYSSVAWMIPDASKIAFIGLTINATVMNFSFCNILSFIKNKYHHKYNTSQLVVVQSIIMFYYFIAMANRDMQEISYNQWQHFIFVFVDIVAMLYFLMFKFLVLIDVL
jgi:hypothetical protein